MKSFIAAVILATSACTTLASADVWHFDCNMQVHGEHSQHYVIALDRNSKSADVQDFRDGKLYATYSQLAITRDNAYGYPPMEFSLPASAATPWTIPQLSSLPVTVQIFDSVSPATVGIAEGPLNPDDGGCARQL